MSFDDKELRRLREIAALDLGARVDDPELQALVERAASELELPVAAVSIVLDSAQYFVASHGLEGWIDKTKGTPGEWAFCRHVVDGRAPFVVDDAGAHELLADNPLVHVDGIRCYLGVPLVTSKDEALGSLCVLGPGTRAFNAEDIERLRALAVDAIALLEARRSELDGAARESDSAG